LCLLPATAVLHLRSDACTSEDLKHRVMLQNKLAGECEEMCKEVGAYPDKCTCPNFVQPDATPGVMTWPELLDHMDNLVAWGKDTLKGWSAQASALQKKVRSVSKTVETTILDSKACAAQDMQHRLTIQNKLADACQDMCKEVGAYPDCECPNFVQPDSTPGVMTWDELLEHMDNLEAWSLEMIKGWKSRAALIQQGNATKNVTKNATKSIKKTSAQVTFSAGQGSTQATHTVTAGCGCVDYAMQSYYKHVKSCGAAGMVMLYSAAGCVEPAVLTLPPTCADMDAPGTVGSLKAAC